METKVRMIIMSHLSDVQEGLGYGLNRAANLSLNFAKFLLLKYPNTDEEVNPDVEFELFLQKFGA